MINTRTKLKNLPALEEYRKGVRMLSKEEKENKIKPIGEMLQDKIYTLKEENFRQSQYIEQLESDKQKLIEINNKYLQKLVYALTPTKHALGDDYNNNFKKIIAENIDLETCKIKRKLKECWGIDKKF